MANVSSSNGLEKRPKLRFPGFDEPWRPIAFGNLVHEYSDRTKEEDEDTLLSAAIEGMFLNTELFGHQRGASNKGYKKIKYGTMVLSTQNLHLGNANVNLRFDHGMVSPAYKTYVITGCSVDLIAQWIKSDAAKRFFYNATTVGASVCRRNVEWDTLYEQSLYLPCRDEQEKVAKFLGLLSNRINKQQRFVSALKEYKRGLHKLVFIKNRKPSWEKSALHDIASFCGGGTPSKDVSSYWDGEIGWISSSDIQEEWIDDISVTRRITKKAIDNSATKLCPEGTIAIVSRVGVGKVAIIPESLCTSQDFTNITSITGNTHYMAYQIAFRMKLEAMKTQGTSIKGVTADTIKSMVLDIPPLEEQKKIADMLTAFDSYIKRAVYELNLFLTMKKALLLQLFI